MPSLRQLKYAIKTTELGSINEASKQLFVSQPSLSNALKNLEDELNITIFLRSAKGVMLTEEGMEFITYARQIVEQVSLMESKYQNKMPSRQLLSISCQHYAFAVHAFAELIKHYAENEYEFTLRETETHNIFHDVSTFRSELGIIYLNDFNRQVLEKVMKEKQLLFIPLFTTQPHVFIGKNNPLADKKVISLDELENYPFLSFEQGEGDSFYYAEEILSTRYNRKSIKVSDRATIFNLMLGIDGYTISSGVLSRKLNDENIISVPLAMDDSAVDNTLYEGITIGWIKHKQSKLSALAEEYLTYLKRHITDYGFEVNS